MPSSADAASPTRVVVIDDHDAIHAAVQMWCHEARPRLSVVASYTGVADFMAEQIAPAVIVLDLELRSRRPDFAAIERLANAGHRVIGFSHIENDEAILRALELGATTYITKVEGRDHLVEAIRAAATDTPYVGPRMASALNNDRRHGRPDLTDREREVLVAWFQTESKDLVGHQLFISPGSVKTYLHRVRVKYAAVGRPAPTKAALVARAVQDGIISIEEL
ncbi:Two component transcriptional regulator, LuxR family [uncultured Mycobacterium sp.]|uniref:Two component transcriptional regulator, LuxR family n=1 Tax=uncultured Mycobacterium sp. TaxID=171292 RepID=A0A1Y5PA35_9MYCO|nr:Two component transcriptional regulator, LuxR family [uncultured Mycobacterium sp.]